MIYFKETADNVAMLEDVNGVVTEYDRHYPASDEADLHNKSAYMLMRKFGWDGINKTEDAGAIKAFKELYMTINGEDASDYVVLLPASMPDTDVNSVLARNCGYHYYKKLLKAGFQQRFSALTAYNMELIKVNPDMDEILDILGFTETRK